MDGPLFADRRIRRDRAGPALRDPQGPGAPRPCGPRASARSSLLGLLVDYVRVRIDNRELDGAAPARRSSAAQQVADVPDEARGRGRAALRSSRSSSARSASSRTCPARRRRAARTSRRSSAGRARAPRARAGSRSRSTPTCQPPAAQRRVPRARRGRRRRGAREPADARPPSTSAIVAGARRRVLERAGDGARGQARRTSRRRRRSGRREGWLTSRFGYRISPFTGQAASSTPGIDIAGAPGTDVIAPARGRVVFAGPQGPIGNSVDHRPRLRRAHAVRPQRRAAA